MNIFSKLHSGEIALVTTFEEKSHYCRLNKSQVRHLGSIHQINYTLHLWKEDKYTRGTVTEEKNLEELLLDLRKQIPYLSVDEYTTYPSSFQSEDSEEKSLTLDQKTFEKSLRSLLGSIQKVQATGLFMESALNYSIHDSLGNKKKYSHSSLFFDYSLIKYPLSAKGIYCSPSWDFDKWQKNLNETIYYLEHLKPNLKSLKPDHYDVYFGPEAIADLLSLFSWNGVSQAAVQENKSFLKEEKTFSPLFSLQENFNLGLSPHFNELGILSPIKVPLIAEGKWIESLTSPRSALKYKKNSHGALESESLRSAEILPGTHTTSYKEMKKGIYIPYVHYLNWSDAHQGRCTGMTRFHCFFIEDGEIKDNIQPIRFDESLYHIFGKNLMALDKETKLIYEVGTYGSRQFGGVKVPGALVKDVNFTF